MVKSYGLRLLPELYEHLNPMPFEAAAQMEKDLAEDLRRAGYTVHGRALATDGGWHHERHQHCGIAALPSPKT